MKVLIPSLLAVSFLAVAIGCGKPAEAENTDPGAEIEVPVEDTTATTTDMNLVSFERDIKPIIDMNCIFCHTEKMRTDGGLSMDSIDAMKKGGLSATSIKEKGADSLLVKRAKAVEGLGPMPPTGDPLTDDQIALLEKWIDEGANE